MLRLAAPLLLVVAAASAAAEETIWLRGRGDDVWIERNGEMREPRDDRKGLTIVSTPARPAADHDDARAWQGGSRGLVLLPPLPDLVSEPPYPYGLDASHLYGLGYLGPPRFWRGHGDRWQRFGDRHHGRVRDRHHGRHVGGDRHHRPRFDGDERRRPERHGGGHRHGGSGGRGERRGR